MTEAIQAHLHQTDLTPRQHFLDSGSITAPLLVSSSHQYGIEVIGPARGDVKWQATTDQGIDVSQFSIDWERQQAICPAGKRRSRWSALTTATAPEVIKIKFSTKECGRCPRQLSCIRSEKNEKRRTITLRPQAHHEALQAARRRQQTPAFASQDMRCAKGSKRRFLRVFVPVAGAVLAILALPKRICNSLGVPGR